VAQNPPNSPVVPKQSLNLTATLSDCHTPKRKGCARHSSAVARSEGSYASMGVSQSANAVAVSGSHSYFSVKTSYSPHGFNFVMCLSSPEKDWNLKILGKFHHYIFGSVRCLIGSL